MSHPPEFIANFLERNKTAVSYYEKALRCEEAVYSPSFPELDDVATTGLRALMKSLWIQQVGSPGPVDNPRFAMDVIALGATLKQSNAPLIPYLRAQSIQSQGYKWFLESLHEPVTSSPAEVLEELERYQDDSIAAGDAFRHEYITFTSGSATDGTSGENDNWLASVEATKRYMANAYRSAIVSAALPLSESTVKDYGAVDQPRYWLRFLKPNGLGEMTAEIVLTGLPVMMQHIPYHRTYNSAVQVLLALKVYHVRHGELPESIDALVPEFFDELPRDWFDGGPIKYNRDKALVYCVGADLVDNGGSNPNTKWAQSEDPSWEIGFAH